MKDKNFERIKDKDIDRIKEAAAIKYNPGEENAPKIIALGKGETAKKILEVAKENQIPIYHDGKLAHTLNSFKIGDEIPQELYEVVAEILVFIGELDYSYGEKYGAKK